MQTIYVHLFTILYVYSCIECVEIFIFGGGCLLKKVIVAYLLRNKKKYEEKNATVKFYVNEL